jgi:hypothetical protein
LGAGSLDCLLLQRQQPAVCAERGLRCGGCAPLPVLQRLLVQIAGHVHHLRPSFFLRLTVLL